MPNLPAPIETLSSECTRLVDFDGTQISVTSAPEKPGFMDVEGVLRHPEGFKGSFAVHDVVRFGGALNGLIGTHDDSEGLFADRDKLPEKGVVVLTDHISEASKLVKGIDRLAQRVIADERLYDDKAFCDDYLELTRAGFGLVRNYAERDGVLEGIPVSLERAALPVTRMVLGVDLRQDYVPGEVRVVTKRGHHIDDSEEDLMVSVLWRALDDIDRIDGADLLIPDFVNPATGSSILGMLVAARQRGATPASANHVSFMATEQGIEYSSRVMRSDEMGNIEPTFYTLGTSKNLTKESYLFNPAVADAGDVLCRYLPDGYRQ